MEVPGWGLCTTGVTGLDGRLVSGFTEFFFRKISKNQENHIFAKNVELCGRVYYSEINLNETDLFLG